MADLIVKAQKLYQWADEIADPRVKDWYFLTSPWPVFFIMVSYLVVVNTGPRLMKDRKPYNLKPIIIVYNLASVVLAAHIFYEMLVTAILSRYNWPCEAVDYSSNPLAIRMSNVFYYHFIARITELFDTVFFILRKKNEQISFLHVYHHCTMTFHAYLAVKYVPGGNSMYWVSLNQLVHVFMYSYYGLAAFGPHMQKYLFWKRYITQFQLIQFVAFFGHTTYMIWGNVDCGFPRFYMWHMHLYAISMLILFGNFYYQAYYNSAKRKKQN